MPPTPSTPPPTPADRRAQIAEKGRARRMRTRMLRRRIAAGAASLFIALFATISIQMATSGNSALGTTTRTTSAESDDGTSSAALTTSSSGTGSSASSGSTASQSSSSAPAAVTTQQS
ncbi:MAG: hypothetical protein ACXVSX_11720 [Solirubrobacteraceae bacterium]